MGRHQKVAVSLEFAANSCIISRHPCENESALKDGPSVMMKVSLRSACTACALTVLLLVSGCHRHRKSKSAPNTDAYSDNLHQLVEKKALRPKRVYTSKVPNLRWPNV